MDHGKMNSRKQVLTDLLAKVDAGDKYVVNLAFEALDRNAFNAIDAYNGSLDAALAFHNAVLGGWRVRIDTGRRHRSWVVSPDNVKIDAYGATPAAALLSADLKALIAQEDGGG